MEAPRPPGGVAPPPSVPLVFICFICFNTGHLTAPVGLLLATPLSKLTLEAVINVISLALLCLFSP